MTVPEDACVRSRVANPRQAILAITGHRTLPDAMAIARSLASLLAGLTPTSRILLSPLAEGADRLAAQEILRFPDTVLHAVLPLPPDDYETDFDTEASRAEFRTLLSRAGETTILPPQPTRVEAYRAVGCHIVDACGILLAVWDGKPSRGIGGTANVVAYARERGTPVIIIDSENPRRIVRERL